MLAAFIISAAVMSSSPHIDPIEAALQFQKHVTEYELPAPPPPPTPSVDERVAQATDSSRSSSRNATALPALLQTIRENESHGNYAAYSPTGCSDSNGTFSCGGAYQLTEQYASGWAAEAGYSGMSSQAQTWPPTTQDAVAKYKFYATNPDGALWCDWTDYC